MSTYDYSDHQPSIGDEAFKRLDELVNELLDSEAASEIAKHELDKANARLSDIRDKVLPEYMDSLGMKEITTSAGRKISIKEIIRASLPKETVVGALKWLEQGGFGAMIKHDVTTSFGKGEGQSANLLIAELKRRGHLFKDMRHVHPSTLSAFVRERLKEGEHIPEDLISVFRQRSAKVG